MRVITVVAGLLGFAAIASGGEAVQFISTPHHYEAEYTYAPGTSEEADLHMQVDRKYKFLFADAQLDPNNMKVMSPDPKAIVREYLEADVTLAIKAAQKKADKEELDLDDVLPGFLAKLRSKTVDCRLVARQMVEHLIGNRIEVKKFPDGREQHRYQAREDVLDTALVARQLDKIVISRDPLITADDNEPHFSCLPAQVGKETAKCGDLRIKYNPVEAQSGVFKGRKALVFNPNNCAKYSEDMDFDSCELNVQIQRCGLRYTQKAEGARATDVNLRGLSDLLEANKDSELRARSSGSFKKIEAAPSQAAPSGFYDEFKTPAH